MSKSSQETIKIQWIRSGIAFNRKQKEIVRSLGLRRLHQVVERPDSPTVRGLIAKIPHLVEIVEGENRPARAPVPEYTVNRLEPAETVGPGAEPSSDVDAQNAELRSA
jgi:large subunit ribosomal protein L30